ncbi:DUF5677 domain-containing protein [Thalassoroseus pseudoceratinae]|uniref:DUF5677 domain-containing protein n=1 Tax=Thalassoroseus pseudoceratinae TaxID=2713176 RepID=UPI00141FB913|nr:DUF5677 domain-containing protein [Thalassoroseus pseudoceratinae]
MSDEDKQSSTDQSYADMFSESLSKHLSSIEPFVIERRKAAIKSDGAYNVLLRASFSKCFEFNTVAARTLADHCPSFFLAPTLRGICEDIIVLRAWRDASSADRNGLAFELVAMRLTSNLAIQQKFFSANRPFQPILAPPKNSPEESQTIAKVQQLWSRVGFNLGGKKVAPTTRDLAERHGMLELYEYIYSITSDMVHFNPNVLMRSGWGPEADAEMQFSPRNFEDYYRHFCTVYGAYLLLLYFNTFHDFILPPPEVQEAVKMIQQDLDLLPRWPEIVTPEEMNRDAPDYRKAAFMATLFHALKRSDNSTESEE